MIGIGRVDGVVRVDPNVNRLDRHFTNWGRLTELFLRKTRGSEAVKKQLEDALDIYEGIRTVLDMNSKEEDEWYVYTNNRRIHGLLMLGKSTAGKLTVGLLATHPDNLHLLRKPCRVAQVGTRLIEYAMKRCLAGGYQALELHSHSSSEGFYERFGFVPYQGARIELQSSQIEAYLSQSRP